MMTSYLMALDERIVSAAPGCFLTNSRYKNESPGPGDGEQNVHAQYAHGIDQPDFAILAAPRPVLICAATQDFVPIAGAWDAFRQAKRVYTRLGFAERMDLIETDAKHGFSIQLREGATRWMSRWLLGKDEAIFEKPSRSFTDRELQCTPTGQVLGMERARSIFDLNREEASRLAAERKKRGAGVRLTSAVRSYDRSRVFVRAKRARSSAPTHAERSAGRVIGLISWSSRRTTGCPFRLCVSSRKKRTAEPGCICTEKASTWMPPPVVRSSSWCGRALRCSPWISADAAKPPCFRGAMDRPASPATTVRRLLSLICSGDRFWVGGPATFYSRQTLPSIVFRKLPMGWKEAPA